MRCSPHCLRRWLHNEANPQKYPVFGHFILSFCLFYSVLILLDCFADLSNLRPLSNKRCAVSCDQHSTFYSVPLYRFHMWHTIHSRANLLHRAVSCNWFLILVNSQEYGLIHTCIAVHSLHPSFCVLFLPSLCREVLHACSTPVTSQPPIQLFFFNWRHSTVKTRGISIRGIGICCSSAITEISYSSVLELFLAI